MSVQLHPGFDEYLDTLAIKRSTRENYKQYARWTERYATHIDLRTVTQPRKLELLINEVAAGFDANPTSRRKYNFVKARRRDMRTVFGTHYRHFLEYESLVSDQSAKLEQAGEFEPKNEREGKQRVLRSIALRRGQRTFRTSLLAAYDYKCAVTGTPVEEVLEAAHIEPYNGGATNNPRNGLLLRSDIHTLFDLKLLSVEPHTLRISCNREIRKEPMYSQLHGKILRTPFDARFSPDVNALARHYAQRVS